MPWKFFQDFNQNNPITSSWLNGVSNFLFGSAGNNAQTSPAAWVRFSVSGSVATIQQSYNVVSVVRNSTGTYTVNYLNPLPQAFNTYSINSNVIGMNAAVAETLTGVEVQTTNSAGSLVDPSSVSVIVFGTYTPQF